jgi:hypothetical protein
MVPTVPFKRAMSFSNPAYQFKNIYNRNMSVAVCIIAVSWDDAALYDHELR